MTKIFTKIAVLFALTANFTFAQNISYVTFPSGLNDLAGYATLYNTQNSRNDSMHVQRFDLSDFSMSGTKQINSIKGRFINPSSTPNNVAQADLVIYDMNGNGQPGTLLFSTTINVSNTDNGNGTIYKDITTLVTGGIQVTDDFFVGIRTRGTDVVQFYVGYAGCGCDNAWLYGPSALNAGDDSWRTLVSRHVSQDLNYYFEVNVSNVVVNQAPVANTDAVNVIFNTPTVINVLANDTDDVSLNPASVTVTMQPLNGTTSVNATTGAVTYTPNSGYAGVDGFQYQVCDNGNPALCSTGTVGINVGAAGISEEKAAYRIYPNPVRDLLNIDNSQAISSLRILSMDGKELASYNGSTQTISTEKLAKGSYVLEVRFESGNISNSTFVKE